MAPPKPSRKYLKPKGEKSKGKERGEAVLPRSHWKNVALTRWESRKR
jgi:hypothetical protein